MRSLRIQSFFPYQILGCGHRRYGSGVAVTEFGEISVFAKGRLATSKRPRSASLAFISFRQMIVWLKRLGPLRWVLLATCVSATLAATSAFAAETDAAPDLAYVGGAGGITCDKFLQARTQNNAGQMELFVEWVQGYRVAYDMRNSFGRPSKRASEGNVSEFADGPAIVRFLEGYCKQHPFDTILDGTIALINEMGGIIVWKPNGK